MTTSQDLLELTVAAVRGPGADATPARYATNAGTLVFQPGDWPTQNNQYPIIKARLLSERKQSLGRGGINYLVTATIRLLLEVSEPMQLNNAGATAAERSLWALVRQCEVAIINGYPLMGLLQQIPSVTTTLAFNSDAATHLAGANVDIEMEFYQGGEDFAPIETDDLDEIAVSMSTFTPTGITIPLS